MINRALRQCFFYSFLFFLAACASHKTIYTKTDDGYQLVFDGKSLDGWEYDPIYWRVENGELVGEVTPSMLLKRNTFIYRKHFDTRDFDLKVEYRISAKGNSGINYRSKLIDTLRYAMVGYQADIDGPNRYTGQNYEERGRTTLAYRGQVVIVNPVADTTSLPLNVRNNAWTHTMVVASLGNIDSLKNNIRSEDWNECHLIVKGNRLQHYINGILMSDVTDNDTTNRMFSGMMGVQVHVGPPMKVAYRNFRMKKI